ENAGYAGAHVAEDAREGERGGGGEDDGADGRNDPTDGDDASPEPGALDGGEHGLANRHRGGDAAGREPDEADRADRRERHDGAVREAEEIGVGQVRGGPGHRTEERREEDVAFGDALERPAREGEKRKDAEERLEGHGARRTKGAVR